MSGKGIVAVSNVCVKSFFPEFFRVYVLHCGHGRQNAFLHLELIIRMCKQ